MTRKTSPYVFAILFNFVFSNANTISIRGNTRPQYLPRAMASSWPSWTFENGNLNKVDDDGEEGWVNPSSFESLYLPSDLPKPAARSALGVLIANGSPRYIMPSVVLTLETPDRLWRNRGLCSLPRATTWIDLFSPFVPALENLHLHCYGKSDPELRFLEDQDGDFIWDNLQSTDQIVPGIFSKSSDGLGFEILSAYNTMRTFLQKNPTLEISSGYHFVDIILPSQSEPFNLPQNQIKMYLTDLDSPRQLINMEGSYEDEVLGELDIVITKIGAGGTSKYLPKVYFDLYDSGNILYS